MRILHTSDWHLGRTLHGVDLLEHQAAHLDHLVELTRTEGVDAVVVAGDVYDRAIPPVDAVSLLSDTVARLAEHAHVVVTPGNHDSAIRLGFGDRVMRPGVHLRARLVDVGTPVTLTPRAGSRGGAPVLVYALPYLDPDTARHALADDAGPVGAEPGPDVPARGARAPLARSHEAVMGAAMRRVGVDLARRRAQDPAARAVVVGHAFVVGGLASESERDIRVGGVDAVPAATFGGWGVDYVALGHLHGPQRVTVPDVSRGTPGHDHGRAPVARYSGSPLAFSFSELHQRKSTTLVDLDALGGRAGGDRDAAVELVPAPVPRRLAEVTGTLDDLLGAAGEPHVDDWLRVVVTDAVRPAELYARVRARFPHALQVTHRPPRVAEREVVTAVGPGRDPLDVARDFVEHVAGHAPSDAEVAVLREAFELALAEERSA
ncbi:exonuclease SbcCD subunit D C-terminal domain-containing protein [Cellulosimicrobium cellulans]|uniref:exonuclease SbcCD subunit D n=1 Tax=Cellulosimicrobium cellulans TaxID=1710 RepID=UPI0019666414|nr:exonuclease SbcCD subunit D C-terminal domain-containing protein [Cellulosimicrobium cellulans]MBN0040670.1 exonuclease SbcCD subunit D C-terminal domain-containing protein [Cellulosimicrobium cellulans]